MIFQALWIVYIGLSATTLAGGPAQGEDRAVTGPLSIPVVVVVCFR